MINQHSNDAGFSAVELLITLFIAVAFVVTGYQLYSIVVGDGGEARARAIASNLAYENLRRVSATTPPCPASPTTTAITAPAGSGLDRPAISQVISAPKGCTSGAWTDKIMKVQINIIYGPNENRQEVSHAVYVAK